MREERKALGSKAIAVFIIALIIVGGVGYYAGTTLVGPAEFERGYEAGLKEAGPMLPEEIKVGVIMSLSGLLGPMGQDMLKGVELAAKEVNDRGGIRGSLIKLIIEDDGTDPKKGLEAAKKLVEVDGVQVITGILSSGILMAIGDYANENEVLVVAGCATSPDITTKFPDDYIFRTAPTDAFQGRALGDIMLKEDYRKIAILTMNNAWGVGIEKEVKNTIPADRITLSTRYDPAKLEYRTELEQVKAASPDAVLVLAYIEDGKVLFRQALELGLEKIPWVTADGLTDPAMFEDPAAAEFMRLALTGTWYQPPLETLAYQSFLKKFREMFNEDPGVYADTAYDAMMMVAMAISYAGAYSGPEIRSALKIISETYLGATGPKLFDVNGDMTTANYIVWKVEKIDDKYDYVTIGEWP